MIARRYRVYPRVGGGTACNSSYCPSVHPPVYPRVGGGTSNVPVCADPSMDRVYPRVGGGTSLEVANAGTELGSIPAWAGEPRMK